MPSYLDFDSTKKFRDFILGRTLNVPNGPQSFNSSNYIVQGLEDMPNVDPGTVETNRSSDLSLPKTKNIFKPSTYFIKENLETLPRRANLSLYSDESGNPYFKPEKHNLIGIMTTNNYNNESELFKFAASYIRDNTKKGPVYARIQQNLYQSTVGRVRIIDALKGNLATATNIITGKEPLIESNYKITVAKSILGKGVDFLQTLSGVEFPFTEIPGDYFAKPYNSDNERPRPRNQIGKFLQDSSGAIGSLFGIQRRPLSSRKPSDLFIDYMGSGQKQVLFDLLSYSRYAPNYTTTARSQNTSKLFNFVDKFAQSVKSILGTEAPNSKAYIGNDRDEDVKNQMSELNYGYQIKSPYYLSTFFDPELVKVYQRQRNYSEGGSITGKLTWYSSKSLSDVNSGDESLTTKFNFKSGSILFNTQQLLETMPQGGEALSHVANVIDQTSKIFKEGDEYLSRGSHVQYVDKYGSLKGEEFGRTWTKSKPYLTYGNTMKKGMNIRKFESSVMSDPWNLNIAPVSQNKTLESSTNIKQNGDAFYAKKYMLSIENLAWKLSNREGFAVSDLPYSERGPNGGRVMWFPPYDLKVNESNSARWESNTFLGRPEPIYTYQSTERTATLSFKLVVDHPSILNLLTNEYFKDKLDVLSPEKIENEINAFFSGLKTYDFYELMKTYTKLSKNDVDLMTAYIDYLNKTNPDKSVASGFKDVSGGQTQFDPTTIATTGSQTASPISGSVNPNNAPASTTQGSSPNGNFNGRELPKKPPLDAMKRIIMKTLSETYYFQKLEETSPVVFQTLREKLKYFHPAFHSMTPEGLNSRLTFLLQCLRPGDTIPIKGISDESDMNARNTTFGPPPICVLRIGDFYHSKVIIRDIQITYEENLWDMNPEGIGIQPMLANVTLQMSFIGGQGLEKPVEMLQNALSSNFFANTEMYDERSISTNTVINGSENFTKTFLEDLNKRKEYLIINNDAKTSENQTIQGAYVGTLANNELNYTTLVNGAYSTSKAYFDSFQTAFNTVNKTFGPILSSALFSSTYRTNSQYDVYTNTGTSSTINLLGAYPSSNDLTTIVDSIRTKMDNTINGVDLATLFGFNSILVVSKLIKADQLLKDVVYNIVDKSLSSLSSNSTIKDLEKVRNTFIDNMDKLNYVIKYGKDAKNNNGTVTQVDMTSFSSGTLYSKYSSVVDYFTSNHSSLFNGLDNSINFLNDNISQSALSDILSVVLYNSKADIISSLRNNPAKIFTETELSDMADALNSFTAQPSNYSFGLPAIPSNTNKGDIKFAVSTATDINTGAAFDEAKLLYKIKNTPTSKLNYYKP